MRRGDRRYPLPDKTSTYQYTCRLIEDSKVVTRIGIESDEIANRTFFDIRQAKKLACAPRCGAKCDLSRESGLGKPTDFLVEMPRWEVGACEHRDPGLVGGAHQAGMTFPTMSKPLLQIRRHVGVAHLRRYMREGHDGGNEHGPLCRHSIKERFRQMHTVLDRIDTRSHGRSASIGMLTVHSHPTTCLVDSRSRRSHDVRRDCRLVAAVIGHPIDNQLAPAVGVDALLGGSGRYRLWFQLSPPSREKAAPSGDRESCRPNTGHVGIVTEPCR